MSVDLSPYLDAVPDVVVERLRGARRVLAVGHENPDADTLGASLAIVRLVEAQGGIADPVTSDPPPPLYDFLPGVERVRSDPDATAAYDLVVISDCGSLDRVGEVGRRHAELFDRVPRVVIDHHASNDGVGAADWIDPRAAATCEMVDTAGGPPRGPARRRRWPAGDGTHGRHRHGHRHVRPSECHAPHARGLGRAGRGGRPALGHLASALPHQAGCPAAVVRARP